MSNRLDEYLSENRISTRAFATRVGHHATSIWRLRRGKLLVSALRRPWRPTVDLTLKIMDESGGYVRPRDIVDDDLFAEWQQLADRLSRALSA